MNLSLTVAILAQVPNGLLQICRPFTFSRIGEQTLFILVRKFTKYARFDSKQVHHTVSSSRLAAGLQLSWHECGEPQHPAAQSQDIGHPNFLRAICLKIRFDFGNEAEISSDTVTGWLR